MNSAYLHIGIAARIAFSLGLHLDKYSIKDGVVAKAHARRLWWTLYLFDQDVSLQLGKPCMTGSATVCLWQPPLPSECVGTHPRSGCGHTSNAFLGSEPWLTHAPWISRTVHPSISTHEKDPT